MAKHKSSTEIINEIAKSLGYKTKYLNTNGVPKRLMISNGKKMCIVNASKFGFYPEISRWQQHLFDSKILTQEVLKHLGYKTIPTVVVEHKKYSSFPELFKEIKRKVKKYPVILKPNDSFQGKDISIVNNSTLLGKNLKKLHQQKKNSLIQPILRYDEYRILIVNNKVEVVHIKKNHHVVGDGDKTIKELLSSKPDREKDETFIKQQLKINKLTLRSILPKDEKFDYHLTRYSSPGDYYKSKGIPKIVTDWAKKLARDISSPTIGIDIFAPAGILEPSKYIVIELNANSAFDYLDTRYQDPEAVQSVITNTLQTYFKK